MRDPPVRILLVEDNPADARLLREALHDSPASFDLAHVERLDAALARADGHFDVILLDLSLPDEQGLATVARMVAAAPETPIVVLTGLDDEEMATRALHSGAQDYLYKGEVDGRTLVRAMRYAVERKRTDAERAQLLERERRNGEQLKLAIREAHHRIKNNLQAISDLLYLELASGEMVSAADVLRESVERIQSIALVHDMLSQEEDVLTVDIRALVQRLVPMALRSSRPCAGSPDVELRVPSVALSSKKATTLVLILNELVSNAVKHAFAGRSGGRLFIGLEQADDGLRLRVEDDGPGLPPGFDLEKHANVGLQVVRTLAERDLGGKLSMSRNAGLTVTVWFPW